MAAKKDTQKISLIFPVYNLAQTNKILQNINREFKKINQKWEAICLLDTSFANKKIKITPLPSVKNFFYPLARFGKGFAFCYGFNKAQGDYIFFWEGNFQITPQQLLVYKDIMKLVNADIVFASKRHVLSNVHYSLFRRLTSLAYQILIKSLFNLKLAETPTGLILYRREVLEKTIPKIIIKNWTFDLEIFVVASMLGFNRIISAPIEIKRSFAARDLSFAAIYHIILDTIAIYYRKNIMNYYRQKFD